MRGIAKKNTGEYDAAIVDLGIALEANPKDEKMKFEFEDAKAKKEKAKESEKKLYARMFK